MRSGLAHFQMMFLTEPDPTKEPIEKDGTFHREGITKLVLMPNFKDPNSQFKDPILASAPDESAIPLHVRKRITAQLH